jgi:hypothetical protein
MRIALLLLTCSVLFACDVHADTTYIKVHFLYGSRPKREFKDTERHWFGGIHGGHVGIEVDSNHIIDFVPDGKFHVFGHHQDRHSRFTTNTVKSFWQTFGSDSADVKRTTVVIPVTERQWMRLDSIAQAYTTEAPYDYAFFGMRCAAAAYDVLARIGVMEQHSRIGTWRRNFYPKIFRKDLLRKAKQEGWTVRTVEGSEKRVWESD